MAEVTLHKLVVSSAWHPVFKTWCASLVILMQVAVAPDLRGLPVDALGVSKAVVLLASHRGLII